MYDVPASHHPSEPAATPDQRVIAELQDEHGAEHDWVGGPDAIESDGPGSGSRQRAFRWRRSTTAWESRPRRRRASRLRIAYGSARSLKASLTTWSRISSGQPAMRPTNRRSSANNARDASSKSAKLPAITDMQR